MKKKTKHRITISRLNGTGVQELFYGKIKAGNNIWIEGEKYTILTTRKKDKKGKWKYTYSKK